MSENGAMRMFPLGNGLMAPVIGITNPEIMWATVLQWASKKDAVQTCYRELAWHLRKHDNIAIRELREHLMRPFEMPDYASHAIIYLESRARKLAFLQRVESDLAELDKMYVESILMPMLKERESELSKSEEPNETK